MGETACGVFAILRNYPPWPITCASLAYEPRDGLFRRQPDHATTCNSPSHRFCSLSKRKARRGKLNIAAKAEENCLTYHISGLGRRLSGHVMPLANMANQDDESKPDDNKLPTAKWGAACSACATAKAKCIRSNPGPNAKCDR